MKRILLSSLVAGMLASSTGCGLLQSVFCYRPCVSQGDCGPGYCGSGCDEGCGPACASMRRPVRAPMRIPPRAMARANCDVGCGIECGRPCRGPYCGSCVPCGDPCGDPCCDPCGSGCYGRCWHRGPLSCLFALLTRGCWWGSGCGCSEERYWGDFYSDPPDCWDPCDCYGNYTGGGCADCGGGYGGFSGYTDGGIASSGGQIISQTDRAVTSVPKMATVPHRATRP